MKKFTCFPEDSIPEDLDMENFWKKYHPKGGWHARDKDGLTVPIIPIGHSSFAGAVGQILFPRGKPDADGIRHCIWHEDDFADGKTPDYVEYCPGHLDVRRGENGQIQTRVVFDNPEYNLPIADQLLLQRARTQQLLPTMNGGGCPPGPLFPREVGTTPWGMVLNGGTEPEHLSNFVVIPREHLVVSSRRADTEEQFRLEVICKDESRTLTVKAEELDTLVPTIIKQFPICHLEVDASKASARIVNSVRDQLKGLPTRYIVKAPGFIQLSGQWLYAHDAAVTDNPAIFFQTGCTIPCDPKISPDYAFRSMLGVLELSDNIQTMLALVLVAHLGPLFKLFEEAGVAPRFVTFLDGQTGSFKTSVSLALFRLFKELPTTPEASFRDTPTALEVKIGDACSRVLLVDDFQPAVTSSAGNDNLAKLEHIIRLFGDGIGKSRSNAQLGRAKEFRPAGCCIITGEDTGGSRSSLLRCLVLSIGKGEIDGTRLAFYQDNPQLLHTHFYHYLQWCGYRGDDIIALIKGRFSQEREFFSARVREPRQADIGACLMLVAQLILLYAQTLPRAPAERVQEMQSRWRDILVTLLQHSEEQSQERDPVDMYLTALFGAKAAGQVRIAADQSAYMSGYHVGFEKDGQWWLLPQEVYRVVVQYWQSQKVIFPLKSGKLHALLAQAKLIATAQENRRGKMKTLYLVKSTLADRPRMLVLYAEQARQYLEQ